MYHAANVLFRTRDGGQTWEKISGDLTRNDKQKQQWSRRPDHRRQHRRRRCTAPSSPSPNRRSRRACSGPAATTASSTSRSDDGKTLAERDREHPRPARLGHGGVHRGQPARRRHRVPRRRQPPHGRLQARTSGRRPTSARPGRRSPTASTTGTFCHAIREDPKKKGLLYLGTERGVMYSPDARQDLEEPATEPADRAGSRPRREGRRSRRRHARPLDLDSRRPDAAARNHRRDPQPDRASLPGPARDQLAPDLGRRTTAFVARLERPEPARRGGDLVPAGRRISRARRSSKSSTRRGR